MIIEEFGDPWPWLKPLPALRDKVAWLIKERGLDFGSTILVKNGGLGDNIQITPLAKALKLKYPEKPVIALVESQPNVLEAHPYIDLVIEYGPGVIQEQVVKSVFWLAESVVNVHYVSRAYGRLPNAMYSYEHTHYCDAWPQSNARLEDLRKHVSDLMLFSLGLENYASSEDVCVTPDYRVEHISGNYVIVQNNTAAVGSLKKWTQAGWDELIPWLRSKNITPVQVGEPWDQVIHPSVLDMRGKTTPRKAAALLQQSKGYIGVEGGLFHLAKAVGAPAVVIFASTPVVSLAYKDTYAASRYQCYPCLWWPGWDRGYCHRQEPHCLNLPSFQEVAELVSRMLAERGGVHIT